MNFNSEYLKCCTKKKRLYIFSLLACLFVFSLILYKNTISLEPSFIHVWAQSDRYALALGFINNNFDFFHPQTYTLDLQFPAAHELKIKEGITRVDFPIHEYIIALLMKLIGSTSPIIFRVYILLYSWVGLLFLALFVQKLSDSRMKGLFAMVFAFTAPVFTYYQTGFLPTIPSIADAMIAFYFYYLYKTKHNPKNLYVSLLFFTLSALSRTPFSILLIAFSGQQLLEWIRLRRIIKKEFIAFICSYTAIAGYFLYNIHLGNTYGSIFLSHPLPAESFEDFMSIVKYSWERWKFDYFTKYHYAVLFFLFILMVVTSYKKNLQSKFVLGFVGIACIGEVLYGILMVQQFIEHDYYFLDTFFIIVILVLAIILSRISIQGYFNYALILFLVVSMGAFTYKTNKIQKERYSYREGDPSELTRNNFEGSGKFLDSLGVSKDAKILVLGSFSYNIPFVKMKRKGYAVLTTSEENIRKSMKEDFDYIVIQDQFLLPEIISSYPSIVNEIEKISGNGKISLYQKTKKSPETIENFIGLSAEDRMTEHSFDFESYIDTTRWSNTKGNTEEANSGRQSGKMLPENEFGLTFTDRIGTYNGSESVFISFESLTLIPPINDIMLVLSIENSSGVSFYKSFKLGYFKQYPEWKKQPFELTLPPKITKDDVMRIYLWNPGKQEFYYDDFKIAIYKPS